MKSTLLLRAIAIILSIIWLCYPHKIGAKSVSVVETESPAQVQVKEPETKEDVKQLIIEVATQYGVDTNLALKIAYAESGYNCKAQNRTSSAGGLYQFINSTFLSTQKRMGRPQTLENKYNCRANAEAAMFLLSKGELSHWKASQGSWQK